jgi:hypothetical protein
MTKTFWILKIEILNLFGIWVLEFGISSALVRKGGGGLV